MNMSQWELKVKTDKWPKVPESSSDYMETGLRWQFGKEIKERSEAKLKLY